MRVSLRCEVSHVAPGPVVHDLASTQLRRSAAALDLTVGDIATVWTDRDEDGVPWINKRWVIATAEVTS